MPNPGQFSLAFLFWELFYVGLTLGCFRGWWMLNSLPLSDSRFDYAWVLLLMGIGGAGAASGRCWGKPGKGALLALILFAVLLFLFGPRVQ